jgi:hypothetical protein
MIAIVSIAVIAVVPVPTIPIAVPIVVVPVVILRLITRTVALVIGSPRLIDLLARPIVNNALAKSSVRSSDFEALRPRVARRDDFSAPSLVHRILRRLWRSGGGSGVGVGLGSTSPSVI